MPRLERARARRCGLYILELLLDPLSMLLSIMLLFFPGIVSTAPGWMGSMGRSMDNGACAGFTLLE